MFHGGQRTAAALVANRRSREFLEERRVRYDMRCGDVYLKRWLFLQIAVIAACIAR